MVDDLSRAFPSRLAPPAWLLAASAVWMAGWAWLVTRHQGPLALDVRADHILAVNAHWQDIGLRLLRLESPLHVAFATGVVAVISVSVRDVRFAAAALAGVAAEIVSVQWAIKPLVGRHEIAPGLSFPSSYVGAVVALATVAVMLFLPSGPLARRLPRRHLRALAALVGALGVVDVCVVSVAAIVTGGHLLSDILAVIPWGVAVPLATGCVSQLRRLGRLSTG